MNTTTGLLPWQVKNSVSTKYQVPSTKSADSDFLNEMQLRALRVYMETLRLKNYSPNTISNYRNWFLLFMNNFPGRKPSTIIKNEILDFLVAFRSRPRWSTTSQNQLINAIKFFFENVLNRPREVYELPRAKKEKKLPPVFRIINVIRNFLVL